MMKGLELGGILLLMMGGKDKGQKEPQEAFPLVENTRRPGRGRSGTLWVVKGSSKLG